MRSAQNVSVENRERKRLFATPTRRNKDNIKKILKQYDVTMWTAIIRLRM
jgi:hypothetical protein